MSTHLHHSRRQLFALGGAALAATPLAAASLPSSLTARMSRTQDDDERPSAKDSQALDELFADLTDQREKHPPITREERAARVRRLGRILDRAEVDALVIEPGATLSYLSEVSWGLSERLFALVVFADGSSLWLSPAFEAPRAEARIQAAGGPPGAIVRWDEHEYAFAPLASALAERGASRVAVEPRARTFVYTRLAAELGPEHVVPGDAIVQALRAVKDPHEIALLRAANELTQRAIHTVAERLKPGTTDRQLGAMMRRAQERLGLSDVWVLPLIGPDAALPHGGPTGRVIQPGSAILVDTGGSFHGYQSDNTRTWIFDGKPSDEFQRAWDTVKAAQMRAFETMKPGTACRDVDRAARAVITEAGYGAGYAAFAHRLGHGIGLEGHEEPYFDGGNALPMAAGMTFSDEPGIYLPERLGIRLEDIVVVTADGADHFGNWQQSPLSPA